MKWVFIVQAFVLTITLLREGYDEFKCHNRDKEINQSKYKKIKSDGSLKLVSSSEIKVIFKNFVILT